MNYTLLPLLEFEINSLPLSVNQMYLRSKRGLYLNSKAKEFKEHVKKELDKYNFQMIKECPVKLEITYYTTNKKSDLDNLNKNLLDSLNGIVFEDDKQVFILNVRKVLSLSKQTKLKVFVLDHSEQYESEPSEQSETDNETDSDMSEFTVSEPLT